MPEDEQEGLVRVSVKACFLYLYEAQKYLKQVKDMGYKQAVSVKGKISVAY